MDSLYNKMIDKELNSFISEVSKLDYNDQLDLLVFLTAETRERHIKNVFSKEFWEKTAEEQKAFFLHIRELFEKRDALLNKMKEDKKN